jgi:PAS domain-containing protein
MEVMERHDMVVPSALSRRSRRSNAAVGGATNSVKDVTDELRGTLDRQKRTFDLAMVASNMGTWRYTLADNVCVYDENAQRLYGLTEARFLHDEEGVKAKFHPDDLEPMWSRVWKPSRNWSVQ